MSFVVIARWVAHPAHEHEVAEVLRQLAAASRGERGCIEYRVHRSTDDPRCYVLYERYSDRAAYEEHLESAHFRRHAVERGIPLLKRREREFCELLSAT
jgi:quinol monooxygenase YgiN